MKVTGVKCPRCKDVIFSRAHHDFRSCSCGDTAIDGGFDYMRYLAKKLELVKTVQISLNVTKKDLYNDWNYRHDKHGLLKDGDERVV